MLLAAQSISELQDILHDKSDEENGYSERLSNTGNPCKSFVSL